MVFVCVKEFGDVKVGEKFDCFHGLVRGVDATRPLTHEEWLDIVIKNGKDSREIIFKNFDDDEFFRPVKTKKNTSCDPMID